MKKFHGWLAAILLSIFAIAGVASATVPDITGFNTRADGNTVTASIWNTELGGIYTYINNNVVTALNTLTTAGDLFVHDGSGLSRLAVGAASNGDVLTIDTAQAKKMKWASPGGVGLTTTGDTLYYNGGNQRLAIGTTGQVLTVAGGLPTWATNSSSIPQGLIAMWSGTVASIPSGWALCDGGTHSGVTTPNLQGYFIVGAGNVSPAGGALGLKNPGVTGGSNSHTHTYSGTTTADSAGETTVGIVGGATANLANGPHTHTYSGGTSSGANVPNYYALAFIEKL